MTKRLLSLLLALLTLFSLTSCLGEYQFGVIPDNKNDANTEDDTDSGNENGGDEGVYVPPTMNNDPTDDFVVTLKADGQPYTPRMDMYVYWSDGFSMHTAKVDENGVAKTDGLDGDYNVTLSDVPNEYTYNPNGNIATNDKRSIEINLYTLNRLSGGGTGIYDCYSFKKTGVYCATIDSPDDAIYFQYAPDGMGTYSIESWVDVTADSVNPYVDVYYGNSQWKAYERTIDDGGPVGSYTINFIHEVSIAKENISAGGQATYTFAIKADVKNNKYPITVTFAVKRNGDFELPDYSGSLGNPSKGMIAPTYDFSGFDKNAHEYGDEYKVVMPEYQYNGTDVYVFDESCFRLWEKSDGGDDFYHVYDEEKYPETDGYGPILYAYITTPCRFIDKSFTEIEYDYKGDILYNNLGAYKHLIEGFSNTSKKGHYYCVSDCPCHDAAQSTGWACPPSCTSCNLSCTKCPEELFGFEGYQAYANSDGLVPVTEDVQKFLLAYSTKQNFFRDGKGTWENVKLDGKYFQAIGDSGWLFACAYYAEK